MKKILSFAIALIFLSSPAIASGKKISEMSFEELIKLREKVNLALFAHQEWQSVVVPQGVYQVGPDIPAGTWTIKCCDEYIDDSYASSLCIVTWGEVLKDNGQEIVLNRGRHGYCLIHHPDSKYYKGETAEYTVTLQEGDYFIVGTSNNKAVFTTYIGKPDLGFM